MQLANVTDIATLMSGSITSPQSAGGIRPASFRANNVTSKNSSFGALLKESMEKVDSLQIEAKNMRTDIELGKSDDLVTTMITTEKAALSLETMIQIRNRIVSAYETVFSMPV